MLPRPVAASSACVEVTARWPHRGLIYLCAILEGFTERVIFLISSHTLWSNRSNSRWSRVGKGDCDASTLHAPRDTNASVAVGSAGPRSSTYDGRGGFWAGSFC